MGAKFTIILDTDDPQGLRDALQIATILNRNHHTGAVTYTNKAKISKIELIKTIREVAKLVEVGDIGSSLRDCKDFADSKWNAFDRCVIDV